MDIQADVVKIIEVARSQGISIGPLERRQFAGLLELLRSCVEPGQAYPVAWSPGDAPVILLANGQELAHDGIEHYDLWQPTGKPAQFNLTHDEASALIGRVGLRTVAKGGA